MAILTKSKKGTKLSVYPVEKKELSALEYDNMADNEPSFEKRKSIYKEALYKYPTTGWLWWNFTFFMHFIKRDYAELDNYYQTAIELNKNRTRIIVNYAIYLKDIKRDYEKAEQLFLMALGINPNSAIAHGNYAVFLQVIKKDYSKAEEHFAKAQAIDPNNPNINGTFAYFLQHVKKDYAKAHKYYLKSLAIDPKHANNNVNFGVFLKDIKKDHHKAIDYFLKALSIDPDNANANSNYARILLEVQDFQQAKKYIQRVINNEEENDTLLELWFYRYLYYPEFLLEAENKIEELLSKGIRSIDWDLYKSIEVAINKQHPHPLKLREFATRITVE